MDKRGSLFLYCFIRNTRPKRIIELGAGSSTSLIAAAVRASEREDVSIDLRSIEPFPVALYHRGRVIIVVVIAVGALSPCMVPSSGRSAPRYGEFGLMPKYVIPF
jgi:hypothetical protein